MGICFFRDEEVVTFRSAEECIEKIQWLLNHEKERGRISAAGKARCLRDHNFDVRAQKLNEIIQRALEKQGRSFARQAMQR